MDDLDKLVQGLDLQQPDWWIHFASHNDYVDFLRDAKAKDYQHLEWLISSRKRSIAQDLMTAVRAALETGLVKLPE